MKKALLALLVTVAALQACEAGDISVFNTPLPKEGAVKKKDCWIVCKERITKVQKLQKALEFYKKSRYYSFSSSSRKKRSR